MDLSVHVESWHVAQPFRVTGRTWTSFEHAVVELREGDRMGRGEAFGVFYMGETAAVLAEQIEHVGPQIRRGIDRPHLRDLLPPGGARSAIDCALWDLECKRTGKRIWELAQVVPRTLESTFTIGIEDTPEQMAAKALTAAAYPLLKVKLDAVQPLERVKAIRAARPDARLIVDCNQAWTFSQLRDLAPEFAALGVLMIEQPLPRGGDAELEGYKSPIPLCADESCLHGGELKQAAARYQMINIKLDKAGGLSHALELVSEARALDLGVMVGCMCGTSLAIAPAIVLGCLCDLVDVDAPLLLKADRLPGITYDGARVGHFESAVWG